MGGIRSCLRGHLHAAWLVIGLALCLKALVPAGFMLGDANGAFGIEICDGQAGGAALLAALDRRGPSSLHAMHHVHDAQMSHLMAGKSAPMDDVPHQRASQTCPYGALGLALDMPVPPLLLGLAIAFILATGHAPHRIPVLARWRQSRPPLRGPPSYS